MDEMQEEVDFYYNIIDSLDDMIDDAPTQYWKNEINNLKLYFINNNNHIPRID